MAFEDGGNAVAASGTIDDAIERCISTIDASLDAFREAFPEDTTHDGAYQLRKRAGYPDGSNVGWTTSFWPGMLWLAWGLARDTRYLTTADGFVANFQDRLDREVDLDTHDLGFLYTLSCVAAWRVTGHEAGRTAALSAADFLMRRFLEPAGVIQAWGDLDNPAQRGRTIIDSLMNTPLLYWAAEQSGDSSYADAALRHARQLRDNVIRPEGSTFHTFYWDVETGAALRGATEQGQADDSCWARGQAWGIYGFALNYRYTGDETLLAAAERCADYYLEHLPADMVPFWDLSIPAGSEASRDTSAAAIAASGLIELANALGDTERADIYRDAATRTVMSLAASYVPKGGEVRAPLIDQGVYDAPKGIGVDEGNLWGDYFYLEALARIRDQDWESYW